MSLLATFQTSTRPNSVPGKPVMLSVRQRKVSWARFYEPNREAVGRVLRHFPPHHTHTQQPLPPMAETLLAIVLVTSSANGSSLICRWPPAPQASPRLARPRPSVSYDQDHYDNPWRSANFKDGVDDDGHSSQKAARRAHDEWEYIWQRPRARATARIRSRAQHRTRRPLGAPRPPKTAAAASASASVAAAPSARVVAARAVRAWAG
ncbi:hypothetical protein BC826DRAFT_617462 [Russula brevipes]|nr:hypothetical protein BC826DRAFT_617462 [Russula brevipes]